MPMRVLIDITHPVNVHFFKNLIFDLDRAGHRVLVTARDKDVTKNLLVQLGIDHIVISRKARGIAGMAVELGIRNFRLYNLARDFAPDVMVAAEAGVSIGPVGAALKIPRVVFDHADGAELQRLVGLPFATTICTGTGYRGRHGRRQKKFRGFLAQAYLDPRRFRPDTGPLLAAGIDPKRPFAVIRLVKWKASHDLGRNGIASSALMAAVHRLSRRARVLITSERPLDNDLLSFANPLHARHLHDLLASAGACISEGGTVAVEAGILGTPAVFCNTYNFGYLNSLEKKFQLIRRAENLASAVDLADQWLADPQSKTRQQDRRDHLFKSTDDVHGIMMETVLSAGGQKSP